LTSVIELSVIPDFFPRFVPPLFHGVWDILYLTTSCQQHHHLSSSRTNVQILVRTCRVLQSPPPTTSQSKQEPPSPLTILFLLRVPKKGVPITKPQSNWPNLTLYALLHDPASVTILWWQKK
jgi:hypothetical protein